MSASYHTSDMDAPSGRTLDDQLADVDESGNLLRPSLLRPSTWQSRWSNWRLYGAGLALVVMVILLATSNQHVTTSNPHATNSAPSSAPSSVPSSAPSSVPAESSSHKPQAEPSKPSHVDSSKPASADSKQQPPVMDHNHDSKHSSQEAGSKTAHKDATSNSEDSKHSSHEAESKVSHEKVSATNSTTTKAPHHAAKLGADLMGGGGGGWRQIWSDEFNGFDDGKWNKYAGTIPGNWDSQMYSPENVYTENGALVIVAKKEDKGNHQYTSGRVDTQGKFSFQYGRIEAMVQLPYGQGIWPAVWLLPADGSCWPNHGEMDVVEGHNYHAFGTMTWGPCGLRAGCTFQAPDVADFSQGFHQFAIEWSPSSTAYFVDGMRYGGTAPDNCFVPTASPFYIIINTAVGGDWSGYPDGSTPFPNFLRVDYVRVFQWQ